MADRGSHDVAEIVADRLVAMLRAGGAEREAASRELRDLLVRAALTTLRRQGYPPAAFGADSYLAVAEDVAQESLSILLSQLDSFRGQSRFTTWCYRIVINLIADEYRRYAWRRQPLDNHDDLGDWEGLADGPEIGAERREVWEVINRVIRDDLTLRQRHALVGRVVQGKALVVLAEELDTNKDNVYKLLHDARKRLKQALLARGISEADALAAFRPEPK